MSDINGVKPVYMDGKELEFCYIDVPPHWLPPYSIAVGRGYLITIG